MSPEPTAAPTLPDEEPPPSEPDEVYGGTLVFALESETTGGWNPITTSAATSGHIVLRQLYDPLVIEEAEIQSFEAIDDLTVKVVLGKTFVDFPLGFTSAGGFLASPAIHDLGTDSPRNPIGTGPFMLEEWVEHEATRLVRNPNYWRTDAEGRQLPYLDAIEFRPIEDDEGRYNTLRAGDVDASVDNGSLPKK